MKIKTRENLFRATLRDDDQSNIASRKVSVTFATSPLEIIILKSLAGKGQALVGSFYKKLRCMLRLTCHKAVYQTRLQNVQDRSIFVAPRNATYCCIKNYKSWGVTREVFLATGNAMSVAVQVARKIASTKLLQRY